MYGASTENWGDSRSFATTKYGAFVMDGEGSGGINPIDTLLASLTGCLTHQIRDFFHESQTKYNHFVIKTAADLTEDRSRLGAIQVSIDLTNTDVSQDKKAKLMGYIKACKIYQTLSANSQIDVVVTMQP